MNKRTVFGAFAVAVFVLIGLVFVVRESTLPPDLEWSRPESVLHGVLNDPTDVAGTDASRPSVANGTDASATKRPPEAEALAPIGQVGGSAPSTGFGAGQASSPTSVMVQQGTTGSPATALPSGEVNRELIVADMDKVSLSLRDYRTLMAQNPVGTNEEITKELNGGNAKGARLAPEDSKINGEGRMVDRWGTPYFFHQISADSMEIHSAGPDKQLGTDDDIILR